jgi:hypothetical protein
MLRLLLAILVFAGAAPAAAQIQVIDYGIYNIPVRGFSPAPQDVAGQRFTTDGTAPPVRQSETVDAQLGRQMGFRFKVTDASLVGKTITIRKTFPKLTNPETGRSDTGVVSHLAVGSTEEIYHSLYRFDYQWEMAEGNWTYELWLGDRLLHRKAFKVVVTLN